MLKTKAGDWRHTFTQTHTDLVSKNELYFLDYKCARCVASEAESPRMLWSWKLSFIPIVIRVNCELGGGTGMSLCHRALGDPVRTHRMGKRGVI